jgi:hypothetical protein
MSDPLAPGPAPMSTGRAVALYTALRLLVFLLCWAVFLVLGLSGLLAAAAAVLASSLVSLVVLRPQRAALNRAALARAERKAAERERQEPTDGSPG